MPVCPLIGTGYAVAVTVAANAVAVAWVSASAVVFAIAVPVAWVSATAVAVAWALLVTTFVYCWNAITLPTISSRAIVMSRPSGRRNGFGTGSGGVGGTGGYGSGTGSGGVGGTGYGYGFGPGAIRVLGISSGTRAFCKATAKSLMAGRPSWLRHAVRLYLRQVRG